MNKTGIKLTVIWEEVTSPDAQQRLATAFTMLFSPLPPAKEPEQGHLGAWSIPKGEFQDSEDPVDVAKRELEEETGYKVVKSLIPLTEIKQKGGKKVFAWAAEGDFDPSGIKSNTFSMEWPPKSGKTQEFPEVDKAEWFSVSQAKEKINANQAGLIEELLSKLNIDFESGIEGEKQNSSSNSGNNKDGSQSTLF